MFVKRTSKLKTNNKTHPKTQILTANNSSVIFSAADCYHRVVSDEKVTRYVICKTAFAVSENSSSL